MVSKPDASIAATMERSMLFKGVVIAVYLGSNISLNMLNKVCLQQGSVMMRQPCCRWVHQAMDGVGFMVDGYNP